MSAILTLLTTLGSSLLKNASTRSKSGGWATLYLMVIITLPIVFYDLAIVWDVIASPMTFDEGAEAMLNHMTELMDNKSKYGHVFLTMVGSVFAVHSISKFWGK